MTPKRPRKRPQRPDAAVVARDHMIATADMLRHVLDELRKLHDARALATVELQTRVADMERRLTVMTSTIQDLRHVPRSALLHLPPLENPCQECAGTGKIDFGANVPCTRCNGQGAIPTQNGLALIQFAEHAVKAHRFAAAALNLDQFATADEREYPEDGEHVP